MKITINGVQKSLDSDQSSLTLLELVKQLGYHPKLIVVEFNGTILNPIRWGKQQIKHGDSLEIVTIVGGGS